jgi:hypothetical protein
MALIDVVLDYHVPNEISLIVVLGIIVGSIALSLIRPPVVSGENK